MASVPPDRTAEQPSGVMQMVSALRRRWWLPVVLAMVGGAMGFLLYATRQPTYRSDAKLRVLKRDAARTVENGRMGGYVDDYVNSQQETIQSEYILRPAATSTEVTSQASPEFQARLKDNPAAADIFRESLAVVRGKDTAAGMGNSVLMLTFTANNPRDARIALKAIIDTFTRDLAKTSNETIRANIAKVQHEIDTLDADLTRYQEQKKAQTDERYNISTQDPQQISTRWATARDELAVLQRQLTEVNSTLELLSTKAMADRRDRNRLVEILTGVRGSTTLDNSAYTLDGQLRMLDLKIKELGERLGKDHPDMRQALVQREYVASELKRLNPENPLGESDDLALYQSQQLRKKESLDFQVKELSDRVAEHEDKLKELRPVIQNIETLDFNINKLKELKATKQADLSRLQSNLKSTEDGGGIEATVLNEPRDGTKVGPVLVTWLVPLVLLGGLTGCGLALALELRDQRFRTPAEVRQRLGLPIIGHLPAIRLNRPPEEDAPADFDPSLVTAVRPKSAEAEAFRGLRTQVLKATEAAGQTLLQMTSPSPGDGKSTMAANLAISLAQAGKSVVLLDADFRKPRVHALFGKSPDHLGLAAAAEGEVSVFDVVQPTAVDNLSVIPCGPRPNAPAELLSSPRFAEVLRQLKGKFDYVVVDTPPLLAVSDPRVVAQRADAVILTLRLANTPRSAGERAAEMLTDLGVNLIGVAVNVTNAQQGYGYGGYGYGGYGYGGYGYGGYGYGNDYSAEGYTA